MPCCGGDKRQISESQKVRYLGHKEFRAHGPYTGRIYVFAGHGSVLEIDSRDLQNVLALPDIQIVN